MADLKNILQGGKAKEDRRRSAGPLPQLRYFNWAPSRPVPRGLSCRISSVLNTSAEWLIGKQTCIRITRRFQRVRDRCNYVAWGIRRTPS